MGDSATLPMDMPSDGFLRLLTPSTSLIARGRKRVPGGSKLTDFGSLPGPAAYGNILEEKGNSSAPRVECPKRYVRHVLM